MPSKASGPAASAQQPIHVSWFSAAAVLYYMRDKFFSSLVFLFFIYDTRDVLDALFC
jgi:hypothetical protein